MTQAPKRHWLRAALASTICGFAFTGGLLANNAPPMKAIAIGALLAILPIGLLVLFERMNWQFSLRTLLIATTLIAVVLATAAYLRLW